MPLVKNIVSIEPSFSVVMPLCANFDPPPPKGKQFEWKVECPLSKWTMNKRQSTFHTKHKLRKNPHPQEKKRKPFHSMTHLFIGCMEILLLKLPTTIFGMD
jgi:hypothetical protein